MAASATNMCEFHEFHFLSPYYYILLAGAKELVVLMVFL